MDEIVKLFKVRPIEEATELFLDYFSKTSDVELDVCLAILKSVYFRTTKSNLKEREIALLCQTVLRCVETLRKHACYVITNKAMVYLYHFINYLLIKKSGKALTIAEEIYSLIVHSKWWKSLDKMILTEQNDFTKIIRNLHVQLWQSAKRFHESNVSNDTTFGLLLISFKIMLISTNGESLSISKFIKDYLQEIKYNYPPKNFTLFVKEISGVFNDLNSSDCNDCVAKEKLLEFIIMLAQFLESSGCLVLDEVFGNYVKRSVTFTSQILSDCSTCRISKDKKKLWNILSELLFASFKSLILPLPTKFLEEPALKLLQNYNQKLKKDHTLMDVNEKLILSVLHLVVNRIPLWERRCSIDNLLILKDVVEFFFGTLECLLPCNQDTLIAKLFKSYLAVLSENITDPEKYPKEFEMCLNALSIGLTMLVQFEKNHISLALAFYNVGSKFYSKMPRTAVLYYKVFCKHIHEFIDLYSIEELLLIEKKNIFEYCCLTQYMYEKENQYEKALDVCARNAFYFGLRMPKQVFESWLRVKKIMVFDKVTDQSLINRTIVDQLILCKDLRVPIKTRIEFLKLEISSYASKAGDYYQIYSNIACLKLISLPGASDVEKAMSTLALCVCTNAKGKPQNWDYVKRCENALDVLEKYEAKDDVIRVRMALGYYSLWQIKSEKLKDEIYDEEVRKLDKKKGNPIKPKGDEEVPDRCDIESAYKHFNIVTEKHLLKMLFKFCDVIQDVLRRQQIDWALDIELYYQNLVMECSATVADLFSGASMISKAVEALHCLLKVSDILRKKTYWIEGVLKLMELMIGNGMSAPALSLHSLVESKIAEVSTDYDTSFMENLLLLLKAEAYYNTTQLKEGICILSRVLSRIFKLSDMDSSTQFWVILQAKAFWLLFKYKKVSPMASLAPSVSYVNEQEYLSLSPTVVILKGFEKIKIVKTTDLSYHVRLAENYHLGYKQYMRNLFFNVMLELGKHYIDLGMSREARYCLSDCLIHSKLYLRTMVGTSVLLQMAFLDVLCDQRFDCDVKLEGLFYMLTYDRLEPLNGTLNPATSPTSNAVEDSSFVINTINQINAEISDYDDDIFLNDLHKMKIKRAKLPQSFNHSELCECLNCKYTEIEVKYLEALRISAKTLILEGKCSEALSLLRVVKSHFQKIENKESSMSKFLLTKIGHLVKECGLKSINTEISPIMRTVKLNLNIHDDLVECFSAMKQFDRAEDSMECAVKSLNEIKEIRTLLPQMEAKIYYRQALLTLHHNCHCQQITIDDMFKVTPQLPLGKLPSCSPIKPPLLTPLKAVSRCMTQNAPKKVPSIYSKISKPMNPSEFITPSVPEKKPGNNSNFNATREVIAKGKSILKQKNDSNNSVITLPSDSTTSPDSEKVKESLPKIPSRAKGSKSAKIKAKKNIYESSDSSSVSPVKSSKIKAAKNILKSSDSSSVSPPVKNSTSSQSSSLYARDKSDTPINQPNRFFKSKTTTNVSTKKENIAPSRNSKSMKKSTKAQKDEYSISNLSTSDDVSTSDDEYVFPKPANRKPRLKSMSQTTSRVTRSSKLVREFLRSDESSPPNVNQDQKSSARNSQNNQRSDGFTIFKDSVDVQESFKPTNTMKLLENFLLKARNVTQHYPDCVLQGEINLLLSLIYYEAKKYSLAGYTISNSVCSSLHQFWINTLQLSRQSNPSGVLLSQWAKEELLYKELFQLNEQHTLSTEFLPADWTIVQINLLNSTPLLYNSQVDKTLSLVITRFQKNKEPLINIVKVMDEQFHISFWSKTKELFVRNNSSLHKASPNQWWEERHTLDNLLKKTCDEMESCWLRFNKCFLLGNFVSTAKANQTKQICRKFLRNCKNRDVNCVSPDILEVLMAAGSIVTQEECQEAVLELFNVTNAQTHHEISQALYSQLQTIEADNRNPVLLVLDKFLHFLPWESMQLLRNNPVFRIPSLLSLKTQMKSYELESKCLPRQGLNAANGFAIVNPDGSIPKSENTMTPFVELACWDKIISKTPTSMEMIAAVTNFDIYFYCGHGAGKVFLSGEPIEQKNCRAAAVLMGCSSGKLRQNGCLEPMGIALQYWLGGCPIVIGNLWDVTDIDIDKFSLQFFKNWLYKEHSGEDIPCSLKLGNAMATGRNSCKLKYIIGSAPVIYGIPTKISNYL